MHFPETRVIEEVVLIKENTQLKRILSRQKGTTSIVSNLNELIIVLPVMGIANLKKKKKRDEP